MKGASSHLRGVVTKLRGGALTPATATQRRSMPLRPAAVGSTDDGKTDGSALGSAHGACTVRVDGAWYDLSRFEHPGGREVIARHAGTDITHLFYSNHFDPLQAAKRLRPFKKVAEEEALLAGGHAGGGTQANDGGSDGALRSKSDDTAAAHLVAPTSEPCSASYLELKLRVAARLAERGVAWRHEFSYAPYVTRLVCLLTCVACRVVPGSPEGSALLAAAAYGLVTGRQTWTHAHNGVHNPQAIPPPMRKLIKYDFVGVVDAWMMEHHAHHVRALPRPHLSTRCPASL